MRHIKTFRVLLAIIALASLLALCVLALDTSSYQIITFLCALICMFMPLLSAKHRIRTLGLLDPAVLFCAAFSIYSGILLFRIGTTGLDDLPLPFPLVLSRTSYIYAGLLNTLAALAI